MYSKIIIFQHSNLAQHQIIMQTDFYVGTELELSKELLILKRKSFSQSEDSISRVRRPEIPEYKMMKLEKGISSIIVEFHNIMTHHSIQLQNKEEFSLADLSDTCLILASTGKDREEGEAERSTVKCLNYKTWWDKNKVSFSFGIRIT